MLLRQKEHFDRLPQHFIKTVKLFCVPQKVLCGAILVNEALNLQDIIVTDDEDMVLPNPAKRFEELLMR